ncbi:hypothetical protein RV10_GL005032 [Enterococcus pallens]|nr:hypothetical protein RV10_GL005032 [Enterococcus pallens]
MSSELLVAKGMSSSTANIAAASSHSGKTTITSGLLQLLQEQGFKVQPYKVGPDYVDTEYHTRITGTASRNLNIFLIEVPLCLRVPLLELLCFGAKSICIVDLMKS